jgi:hypothetical protein
LFICHRHHRATIAHGYDGDGVVHPTSDGLMMSLESHLADRLRWWLTAALRGIIGGWIIEAVCLVRFRDSRNGHIFVVLHPVEAIRT